MATSAKAVANCFLELANEHGKTLTPMKMQKLVYYAHGWHLAIKGTPLINEQVEAWKFGPVIRSLYAELAHFGNKPITEPIVTYEIDRVDGKMKIRAVSPTINPDSEDGKFECNLLKKVWDIYGGYSATELSNMTHADGSPWHQVFQQNGGILPKGTDIPSELIKTFFRLQAKKTNA